MLLTENNFSYLKLCRLDDVYVIKIVFPQDKRFLMKFRNVDDGIFDEKKHLCLYLSYLVVKHECKKILYN